MTIYPPPASYQPLDSNRFAAWIALVGSALLVLFWALYFSGWLGVEDTDGVLAQYEAAFPFADAVLALTLLVAGLGLMRGKQCGRFCLTGGSSMAVYLGVLDFTFYYRQGFYTPLQAEGAIELVVNLLCVVGGLIGLGFSWRLRREGS